MMDHPEKKSLAQLTNNTSLIKDLLSLSGRLNQHSGQFPQSSADIQYYQKVPGFQSHFTATNQQLQSLMHQLALFVSPGSSLPSSGIIKYRPVLDLTDNLLENVDLCLDKVNNHAKDQEILDKIQRDQQAQKELQKQSQSKPQNNFIDNVDNSNVPFVPRLPNKPHNVCPLDASIVSAQNDPESFFSQLSCSELNEYQFVHPYFNEITHLVYTEAQMLCPEPITYNPFLQNDYTMIDSQESLMEMVMSIQQENELAIDLEHHSNRTYQGITCLIQISSRNKDYIVDTLVPEVRQHLHVLNQVTTDPQIVKVLHGAESDVMWLQRDFGVYLVNMFDTYHASRLLQLTNLSLKYLLDKYCRIIADKKMQLADWRVRPLTSDMLDYARQDTHYLLFIYDSLKISIRDYSEQQGVVIRQNILQVLNDSSQTCLQVYSKPVLKTKAYYFLLAKQKPVLSPSKYVLLKQLLKFRDQLARDEDESVTYVMNNQTLFQLLTLIQPIAKNNLLARVPRMSTVLLKYQDQLLSLLEQEPEKDIYVKSQENHQQIPDVIPTAALKWLYSDLQQELPAQQNKEIPTVNITYSKDYQQNAQFLPRQPHGYDPRLLEIEKSLCYQSETHFLKAMIPQIAELYKAQMEAQQSQMKQVIVHEQEKEPQQMEEEILQREDFIEIGKDKGDGNRNIFIATSGRASQNEISRQVVNKKQSQSQSRQAVESVRQEKFKEEQGMSKQQMRDIVRQFNEKHLPKERPADPVEMMTPQNKKQKKGNGYKKSIFGGPRSKAKK